MFTTSFGKCNLTEPEWLAAIQFLTDVGKTCTDKRQEFILLSDTLGVSVLVITLNHPADQGSAESTVLGPFYWEGAPDLPRGSNLAEGVKGEPAFYSGRVLSADGRPLENALLDIWSGDGEGNYDMQIPGETGMKARGRIRTDADRALLVPFDPADILSGSHRWAGRTHAAQDGAPSVSPRPHPHDCLGARTLAGDDPPVRRREPILGLRCRVRDEGVAGGAIRAAPSGSWPLRRAHGHAVLHGELRLPIDACGCDGERTGGTVRLSTDRILTTHVGSLPRSQAVTKVLFARERGDTVDARADAAVISDAVAEVVRRQVAIGIDVVSDGEMSKISYATYIAQRFSGFAGDTPREPGQDLVEFPGLLRKLAERGSTAKYRRPRCVGPVKVEHTEPLLTDLQNMLSAVKAASPTEAFMNAASPGVIALFQPNDYYPTQDDYLIALAEALRTDYEAIVESGIMLQIDAPDLAMGRHTMYRNRTMEEFEQLAARHIEVLNHALRNVPADRVRMHVCWGNYEGPHHHDVPMERLLPIVLKAKPQGLLFEAANPRHAHEWAVFRDQDIPDDKILIPGVLLRPRPTTSSIRCWWRSASNALRTSSDASASSPAPIAASGPSRASARWSRTSPT